MDLVLFDDRRAGGWKPFRLTRPVGEILFGCLLLRERAEKVFGARAIGHLTGEGLLGFDEAGAPPTLAGVPARADRARVFLSSRFVAEPDRAPSADRLAADRPATLLSGGRPVGWIVPSGEPAPAGEALLDRAGAPPSGEAIELGGVVLEWPWSLVEANARQVAHDVRWLHGNVSSTAPEGVVRLGGHALSLGEGVEIEPGVVLDTREGPIRLDDNVTVQGPARLTGPLFVGRDTLLFGGSVGTSSVGPVCKVRGEVDSSVLTGYCNKAHDGYLGHALLGRWVNLGALTTNSDLKNNYSRVRVSLGSEELDTGLLKVGCFLGDHVKTGIGTLLNTGSVVGAGSNLFGGAMPPRYVPPFSWGSGAELVEFRLDKFFEVARAAMARRDVELSEGMEALLARAWEATRAERGT